MTKRATSSPRQTVKLTTVQNGERIDYIEPSVVCAAKHGLAICDGEEGCLEAIEVNGETIWKFDCARGRESFAALEELADGVCVS